MKIFTPLLFLSLLSCSIFTIDWDGDYETEEVEQKPQIKHERTTITKTTEKLGEIRGTVYNCHGEIMSYSKIILVKGEELINSTYTDQNGTFIIKDINPDIYILVINHQGYSSIKISDIEISNYEKIDYEVINMECGSYRSLKPVIYLYPEQRMNINVTMNYEGILTHTYPKYPDQGWNVNASADGTLIDEGGQEYYALFWEGKPNQPIQPKNGFIIPGKETTAFLEQKLEELGLNRREANEFIMFWLPRMENNKYNFIHFASMEYEKQSQLVVTPKPETTIRVMMLTQPLEYKIEMPEQDISSLKKTRKGYTLVEWGGTVLTESILNEF